MLIRSKSIEDRHRWAFFALLTLSLLFAWRTLQDTLALSLQSDSFTYILAIIPISLTLLFLERRSAFASLSWSSLYGSPLLVASAVLALIARFSAIAAPGDVRLTIEMSALVLFWLGAFLLCFGPGAFRRTSFPLLFLVAVIPLPDSAVSFVIALLQEGSAWSARLLFEAFQVPVLQRGLLLTIPGFTLEVAPECSSIRSSTMLLVVAAVVAWAMLRSPWRRALLILAAVQLCILKNGLRIFTLGFLATKVDPAYLNGNLHRQGGVIFLAIAMIALFGILLLLRRGETHAVELSVDLPPSLNQSSCDLPV